jgi:hypothetical protein
MISFIQPRLRKPAILALCGTMLAAAWAVRGGPAWFLSIVIEVTVLVQAVTMYVRGGQDSDEGALVGSRPDERQRLVGQRSWALGGKAAMIVAMVGLTIAIATRATWWWPVAVIIAVLEFGYLLGLSKYGVGSDAADDPTGYQARAGLSGTR